MEESRRTYDQDEVYQELALLCEQAGIRLYYSPDVWECEYAKSRPYEIAMPDADVFDDDIHAAHVLGHEIGHIIIEPWYSNFEQIGLDIVTEAECDRIGAVLYRLAEMIAVRKITAMFRSPAQSEEG